jgi:hypothetical protein
MPIEWLTGMRHVNMSVACIRPFPPRLMHPEKA